ncbi:uncharacterized protein LOC120273545 [Dioscorea cayenensis subsp. rotundata]|nr:uncharacterized protein LOC120273545 [Dioscorea cayenensis subsp. rotundata]
MKRITCVLKDAEKKKIQDDTVKLWVDELKDLMYDADDIIDLCMIQGTGLLQDDHHHSLAESSATASTRNLTLWDGILEMLPRVLLIYWPISMNRNAVFLPLSAWGA